MDALNYTFYQLTAHETVIMHLYYYTVQSPTCFGSPGPVQETNASHTPSKFGPIRQLLVFV